MQLEERQITQCNCKVGWQFGSLYADVKNAIQHIPQLNVRKCQRLARSCTVWCDDIAVLDEGTPDVACVVGLNSQDTGSS